MVSPADERAGNEAALEELDRAWLLESTAILGHVHDPPATGPRVAGALAGVLLVVIGAGGACAGADLHDAGLVEAGLGTTACVVAVAAVEERKTTRWATARARYETRRQTLGEGMRA